MYRKKFYQRWEAFDWLINITIVLGVITVLFLVVGMLFKKETTVTKKVVVDEKYATAFDFEKLDELDIGGGPSPPMGLKITPNPFVYYIVRFKGSSRKIYCESYAYEEGGIVLNVVHKDTTIKKGKPLPMKMIINKDSMYSISLKESKTKEEALKKRG